MYCGRHYNDLFKARCAACDESIMEDSYVKAEGSAWHRKHFCCFLCDELLAGKQYVDSTPYSGMLIAHEQELATGCVWSMC